MTEAVGGGSPAAAAPAGAPPAPEPVTDERLANISLWARLMRRPELGSLLGRNVGWSSCVRSRRTWCPPRSTQSLPNSGSRSTPAGVS